MRAPARRRTRDLARTACSTAARATIERIYVDYDGKIHLGVTIDDDPGQELMRESGRYLFFFAPEVEVIDDSRSEPSSASARSEILVAGVGNAWLRDDGFGGEVARRLDAARAAGRRAR